MTNAHHLTRRQFVSMATAAGAASLVPAGAPALAGQDPVIDTLRAKGHGSDRERVTWTVEPFRLEQVRLLDGPFKQAAEINRQWLNSLPADRLLHSFRLTAGLASSAEPLGGWEKPDCELRGHFAGGHYLSACALAYAATGNDAFRQKGNELVVELAKCQEKLGNGYLSAFPEEFFDRLREGNRVWA